MANQTKSARAKFMLAAHRFMKAPTFPYGEDYFKQCAPARKVNA